MVAIVLLEVQGECDYKKLGLVECGNARTTLTDGGKPIVPCNFQGNDALLYTN